MDAVRWHVVTAIHTVSYAAFDVSPCAIEVRQVAEGVGEVFFLPQLLGVKTAVNQTGAAERAVPLQNGGATLTPRVRIMAVCDQIREHNGEPGVFDLKGVRQTIQANEFPFVPRRLALFLIFTNPRPGSYPGYVRVINERTDKTVFYRHLIPTPQFDETADVIAVPLRMRCQFAEPDRYIVQVSFYQERGSDIVKGELPNLIIRNEG
jgi:hypothetical protein